ncbi:MAG: hypothetical protein H0W72_11490, partial [Planctomycetes bacterium]|nr:hypothetical protein [Planctomycetota bacterium]
MLEVVQADAMMPADAVEAVRTARHRYRPRGMMGAASNPDLVREQAYPSMCGLRFAEPPPDAVGLRREILFAASKWDAQVGDIDAIATSPLVLSRAAWQRLALDAASLAGEVLAAEGAMEASGTTGRMPRRLRSVAPSGAR